MRRIWLTMCLGLAATACSKKDESKGDSIGAPEVQPPVTDNLPTGFTSAATLNLADDETSTVMQAIKDYLYPTSGFVGPVDRLGKIDDRMAELDSRAQDAKHVCLGETAKAFAPAGSMGDGSTLAMELSCLEAVSTPSDDIKESQVGFGMTDDDFFLVERTFSKAGSGIVVFVKEPKAGSSNEVWELRYKSAADTQSSGEESVTWLHIKSAPGSAEVVTAASDSKEGAMSCGVQMKANRDLIFVSGAINTSGPCGDAVEYCADAKTLAAIDVADCTKAGLNKFSMTELTPASMVASLEDAKAISAATISGFTDFGETE